MNFDVKTGGVPVYDVSFKGRQVIKESRLGLELQADNARLNFRDIGAVAEAQADTEEEFKGPSVKIAFKDGSTDAKLIIKPSAPAPTPTPKPVPRTGDSNNIALWLTLIAIGLVFICGTVMLRNLIKNSDGKK